MKREHRGFFAMICAFTFLEAATEFTVEGSCLPDILWSVIFLTSLILFLILRFLEKQTSFLEVPGR